MATPSLAQQHVTAIVSVIAAAPYALFLRELFLTRSHTAYSQTFSHVFTHSLFIPLLLPMFSLPQNAGNLKRVT